MNKPGRLNWRGGRATRLEALTDAVFGFAITLLVVSLEVPTSLDSLLQIFRGFAAFAGSFAVLIMVWLFHYNFFKRYDLDDGYTIFLNSALLFVVLLYVYPLKFVFSSWLAREVAGIQGIDSWADLRLMFAIYGLGFCAVFTVFTLLYHHAYRRRETLQLSPLQVVDAREQVAACLVMMAVGLTSVAIALSAPDNSWSIAPGPIYMLIGPVQWVVGRRYARLKLALDTESADPLRTTTP